MDAKSLLGEPRVLISAAALQHNAKVVRRALQPHVKICAMLKADGYGHGASLVVDALCHAIDAERGKPFVDAVAVASMDEADSLPDAGVPMIVFRPIENVFIGRQRQKLENAIRSGWVLTVCTAAAAEDIARVAIAIGKRASVQVMVDTGMTRSGTPTGELGELMRRIDSRPALRLFGVCTHFSSSEDPGWAGTAIQLARFRRAIDGTCTALSDSHANEKICRHAANSGGVFFFPNSHLDMVRPGISLYGIDPSGKPVLDRALRPVMKWTAPLIGIQTIEPGAAVGYGQTWTAARTSRIGLLPIGYADGFVRAYSNRAVVMVHGKCAPVVGRVSMDLTTIDLTDVPAAQVGDEVVLLDNDPLSPTSAYAHAEWAQTIAYEIFCRIGSRVQRVWSDAPATMPEIVEQ
jgi:alanine racemase